MSHYVKNKVQSGVKGRKSYSSMMTPTFLDPKTGNFKQLNQSPWFLKMKNGTPGYFLKMEQKFQQMPEDCFKATAARSATFNLKDVEAQIENFFADNLGFMEVKNDAIKN